MPSEQSTPSKQSTPSEQSTPSKQTASPKQSMPLKDRLSRLRKKRGLSQEELAAKLFVTRQAVSRWENGHTTPSIDTLKLIAYVLNIPTFHLIEIPDQLCHSCGMALLDEQQLGSTAEGLPSPDFCTWCYSNGEYIQKVDMEQMIEDCAPRLAHDAHLSLDEAVSLMAVLLPHLRRWNNEVLPSSEEVLPSSEEKRLLSPETKLDRKQN